MQTLDMWEFKLFGVLGIPAGPLAAFFLPHFPQFIWPWKFLLSLKSEEVKMHVGSACLSPLSSLFLFFLCVEHC